MAWPKIVYDPGTGDVTLTFKWPNRFVPTYSKEAERHDIISSGGRKQAILERLDEFLEFDMPWIDEPDDAEAWQNFLDYALTGEEFDYYPDADVASFTTYTLENDEAKLAYKAPQKWELTGARFRKVVT